MGQGRREPRAGGRMLGVILLTLSILHMPLPQPDFHNIRHHDAPGELCEHHDHLLRWHPGASGAQDVSVLHWHWFFPSGDPTESAGEHDGRAMHAHLPDWSGTPWNAPVVAELNVVSRLELAADSVAPEFRLSPSFDLLPLLAPALARPTPTSCAPLARRGSTLVDRLQRWVC